MESYIEKALARIDAQFIELDIRDHGLAEFSNVSVSKFEKDFKRTVGLTANQYIKKKKIEKARELRQNPDYKQFDIMALIGWNYSERSYREAYKKLAGVSKNAADGSMAFGDVNDFLALSDGRHALDEILLRFILYLQLGTIKKRSPNSVQFVVDIKDTLIQFTPFGLDDKLYFFVFYDVDNDSVHTSTVSTRIGDKKNCYIPNSFQPYLNILNNIYHRNVGELEFDIREAIQNWKEFGISESAPESFLNLIFMGPSMSNLKIEVDAESDFIEATNPLIRKLKEQFRTDITNTLDEDFNLSLQALLKYTDYLDNDDLNNIERFVSDELLRTGAKRFKLKALDLILRVTECPVLQDLELKKYEYEFPRELLKKITSEVDTGKIGNLLREFREAINLCPDNDDYNPTVVLDDLLREV